MLELCWQRFEYSGKHLEMHRSAVFRILDPNLSVSLGFFLVRCNGTLFTVIRQDLPARYGCFFPMFSRHLQIETRLNPTSHAISHRPSPARWQLAPWFVDGVQTQQGQGIATCAKHGTSVFRSSWELLIPSGYLT